MKNNDPLARVAESVSSRETVNWEAESHQAPALVPQLRAMEAIEAVRAVFEDTATEDWKWGKLRILDRLGNGGGGDVYLALDPMLDKKVALKLVKAGAHGEAGELALDEARKLARVDHPNVVRAYGVEQNDGQWGLWMDLVPGENVDRYARSHGLFGADEALVVGRQVCQALAAVHKEGLVHRDVKASNVMRSHDGNYVLMDFGLVRDMEVASEGVAGTRQFMSPELFEHKEATPSSDLYALGVVLFFLVTGEYPVDGANFAETRYNHREGNRKRLVDSRPNLPVDFVELVERLMAPDSKNRFATAGEAMAAMGTARTPHKPSKPQRSIPLKWMAAAAAGIIAAVWIGSIVLAPFEVKTTLKLYGGGGSNQTLQAGSTVHVGDQLFLELEASKQAHVYVVNYDSEGRAYVLFPNPAYDLTNPVDASKALALPGPVDGTPVYWNITSSASSETILALVSPNPVESVVAALASLPAVRAGSPLMVQDDSFVSTLRGAGGFSVGRESGTELLEGAADRAAELAFESAREGSVRAYAFRYRSVER